MNIGIISDTHDDVEYTNKAIDIFEKKDVKVILHAGDIISPAMILEFQRLTEKGVRMFGILGNNDGEKNGIKEAFRKIGGEFLGDVGKIKIDEVKFGMYHGHEVKKTKKFMNSNKFDVFIFGHSHIREPKDDNPKIIGKTLIFNPGSAHRKSQSGYTKRDIFGEPTILIFDTKSKEFEFIYLD